MPLPLDQVPNPNTVCVLPWTHINLIPRGKVYHCCMNSKLDHFIGDLNKDTLEEVWNSENMKTIRKQMLNGERPAPCSKCFESEDSSGNSHRLNQNKDFPDKLAEIPEITDPDGHVEKMDLQYWDFRFSNLCNLKCRTCGPEFSSAWIPDGKKLGWIKTNNSDKVLHTDSVDNVTNLDFIIKHIDQVKKIYFAGGEPLLMDEHWQILDMLDAKQRYDVILSYNSNLSSLEYKGKNALDYWKKWKKHVWLWPSIDDFGPRAELIRSGTNWPKVEENLKAIKTIGIHVRPSITVSAMNVYRVPEILDKLIELGMMQDGESQSWFSINVVEYNPHFHVSILPDETRRIIKEKIEKYILTHKETYGFNIRNKFLHLFWHLDKPWNKDMAQSFKTFTNQIDLLRDEKTIDIIPELREVLE